jgi:hypothetical protein
MLPYTMGRQMVVFESRVWDWLGDVLLLAPFFALDALALPLSLPVLLFVLLVWLVMVWCWGNVVAGRPADVPLEVAASGATATILYCVVFYGSVLCEEYDPRSPQ